MIAIDSHLHVWDPRLVEYPWLAATDPLHRRVDLDDVIDDIAAAEVDAVVLVQAADSAADTAHMRGVANRHPTVAGVIAWVPLDDVTETEERLEQLRSDRRIVGVRNLTHDRADPEWLLRPEVGDTVALLAERGVPLDVVTSNPSGLRVVASLADRHPSLRLIIDHLGKPPPHDTRSARAEWRALLADCAGHAGTTAKLSGFTMSDIAPTIHDAMEMFGADRLMAGSDWPLSTRGGYVEAWRRLRAALAHLGPAEASAVLGGTAQRVYGIDAEAIRERGEDAHGSERKERA